VLFTVVAEDTKKKLIYHKCLKLLLASVVQRS
jgi:hypothetical protein